MKGFFILLLATLAGCTATKLTSSWTAPTAGIRDYRKILVVAITENKDSVLRKEMEAHLVNDLSASGFGAIAFSKTFQFGEMKSLRYDSIRQKLSRMGIDGVVTISLLAVEKERVYVQERPTRNADNLPLGGFWSAPSTVSGKSGQYVTSTQYFWETSFYDVATIDFLYNARSTAFEVTSTKSLAHRYGKMIVADMKKNYLLAVR